MFVAVEPSIKTAVLANPGAIYTDTFQNSTEVSPLVNAGLAAQGVAVGSADYNAFMAAAQTVADDADPFNYGAAASAKNILLLKTTPDDVVPNSATDSLIAVLGPLTQVGLAAANSPVIGSGYVNYISGTHSTFLTPAGKPDPVTTVKPPLQFIAATTEMQTATATFLGSAYLGSAQVTVTTADTAIVE